MYVDAAIPLWLSYKVISILTSRAKGPSKRAIISVSRYGSKERETDGYRYTEEVWLHPHTCLIYPYRRCICMHICP